MASSSTPSLNGLVRNSTAPAFIARTVIGTSPYPVMKMIGISDRSASCCCRSRPLSPGSVTSSTRQHGTAARGRARNSRADANVSGCQPALSISSSSDSRTEMSSSTTKTMAVTSFMGRPRLSLSCRPERGVERVEQRRIAEWLEQARHRPTLDQQWPKRLVALRSNKDDRDVSSQALEFALEVRAAHARQTDIEDQAVGLVEGLGLEERLRRRERLHVKAELQQQVGQ